MLFEANQQSDMKKTCTKMSMEQKITGGEDLRLLAPVDICFSVKQVVMPSPLTFQFFLPTI